MTIKQRKDPQSLDAFIKAAPDSAAKVQGGNIDKAKKKRVTPTITPELIEGIDAKAAAFDISRAKFITLALQKALGMSKAELLL